MSERLDRIEGILLRVVEQQALSQGEITELSGITQNLSDNLALIIEEQRRDRQEFRDGMLAFRDGMLAFQTRMEEIRLEIRGLQTESYRIWEQLQHHRNDGHGN